MPRGPNVAQRHTTTHNATQRHTTTHNATQRRATSHNVAQRRTTSRNGAQRRHYPAGRFVSQGNCVGVLCNSTWFAKATQRNAPPRRTTSHHAAQRRPKKRTTAQITHSWRHIEPPRTHSHNDAPRSNDSLPSLPQKCPCRTLFHFDTQSTKPR